MFGKSLHRLAQQITEVKPRGTFRRPAAPRNELENLSPVEQAAYLRLKATQAQTKRTQKLKSNLETLISIPPVTEFIEKECIDAETVSVYKGNLNFSKAEGIELATHQKRILTHLLTINPITGRFPYMTVVYSAPKKSGKTAVSAYVGAWAAKYLATPAQVKVLANDRDQAHERAMKAMFPTLHNSGSHRSGNSIFLPNGSTVEALTNQPESESGGHYLFTLWTELWAFTLPRSVQLWAEMMPIATEPLSIRWVDSYAGYEDKSVLLWELFTSIFTDSTESELHPAARPVKELEDIRTTDSHGNSIPCCYERPDLGLFYYVDHEYRMPWQQEKGFFEKAAIGLTETDINRLLKNRWQKTENPFVSAENLKASVARGRDHLPTARRPMVFALDGTLRNAHAAIVGVYDTLTDDGVIYETGFAKSFDPKGEDLNLEKTLGEEVVKLWKSGMILKREPDPKEKKLVDEQGYHCLEVHYDNYQMATVVLNLRDKYKILLKEFNQGAERLRADTFLQTSYEAGTINNPDDPELLKHLNAASAEQSTSKNADERIRIIQNSEMKNPVDLAVCQSMATYRMSQRPRRRKLGSVGVGKAKGLI